MHMPIQAAPIDRANRAVAMQSKAGGMYPSVDFGDLKGVVCPACDLLPNPIVRAICRAIVCGDGGGIFGRQ
jgi:hypothetical protein